jgi:hypothetical protein
MPSEYFDMQRIIGLVGQKGVGKTTVAQHLVTRGYMEISFADTLKDSLCVLMGVHREMFDLPSSKEQPLWNSLSPRQLMQRYGDLAKALFGPDVFIDALRRRLATIDTPVVISDVRFAAEEDFVRSLGARLYRVVRSTSIGVQMHDTRATDHGYTADLHDSESLQHLIICDRVIYNDGRNLEQLETAIDAEFLKTRRPVENRCVLCAVDLGSCNPRQLCGKYQCENLG